MTWHDMHNMATVASQFIRWLSTFTGNVLLNHGSSNHEKLYFWCSTLFLDWSEILFQSSCSSTFSFVDFNFSAYWLNAMKNTLSYRKALGQNKGNLYVKIRIMCSLRTPRPICRSTSRPTYRSTVDRDVSVDMSTDISDRYVGRYVDRHISIDISAEYRSTCRSIGYRHSADTSLLLAYWWL